MTTPTRSVQIDTVANGFSVTIDAGRYSRQDAVVANGTYVFETFENLTEWLDKNLAKPTPPKPEGQ